METMQHAGNLRRIKGTHMCLGIDTTIQAELDQKLNFAKSGQNALQAKKNATTKRKPVKEEWIFVFAKCQEI